MSLLKLSAQKYSSNDDANVEMGWKYTGSAI